MLLLGYAVTATILGSRRVCRRCGKRPVVAASRRSRAMFCKYCAKSGLEEWTFRPKSARAAKQGFLGIQLNGKGKGKMFQKIAITVFNAAVVLVSIAVAVWLTITGHTLQVGGLLIAMGAVLGAVMFGFRLAEGVGPDRLSIWAGPFRSIRPPAPVLGESGDELRKAA